MRGRGRGRWEGRECRCGALTFLTTSHSRKFKWMCDSGPRMGPPYTMFLTTRCWHDNKNFTRGSLTKVQWWCQLSTELRWHVIEMCLGQSVSLSPICSDASISPLFPLSPSNNFSLPCVPFTIHLLGKFLPTPLCPQQRLSLSPSCAKWHIRAAPISGSPTLGHPAVNCSASYSRGLVYW